MSKKKKQIRVLSNYNKILETEKNKILKKARDLETYKKNIEELIEIIYYNINGMIPKNAMFSDSKSNKKNSNGTELEIFILNPKINNSRLIDKIKAISQHKKNIVSVIYLKDSIPANILEEFSKNSHIELLVYEEFEVDKINQIINLVIHVIDVHLNVLKNATKAFLTSNLFSFEVSRIQLAPIVDDKLDFVRNQQSNKYENKIEVYVPTRVRWKINAFEQYIFLKIRKTFIDLEILILMQEILKINHSIDLLEENLEKLSFDLITEKIKNSSDELSVLQGGEDDN